MEMAAKGKEQAQPEPQFQIDPDESVYVIGVVSSLVGLPIWTLRMLDRQGLVTATRQEGCTRLYSLNDLRRLAYIKKLMLEQRVNVHGVKVIMSLTIRNQDPEEEEE